jgi:predicted double-glycine peptidase
VRLRLPVSRLALVLLGLLPACAAAGPPSPPVRSLLEIRNERVVLQRWDLSCGAAALATLLTFQQGDPVSEREVALGLMGREEYLELPELVTVRQGFSLLDLERYVEGRGYRGRPLGGLAYGDLAGLAPLVVAIDEAGYDHFVVYRGQMLDRVLLADPSFGTRTMRVDQFERAWIRHGELGRVGFVVERRDGRRPPGGLAPRPEEFPTFG